MDEEEKGGNEVDISFQPLSKWIPPKCRDATLETYIKRISTDVECQINNLQAKQSKDKISSREERALKSLC